MTQASRICLNLAEQLRDVAKDIVIERVAQVVEATPVDTTWARANWIATVGEPPSGPAGSPDAIAAAQSAQQAGIAAVLSSQDPDAKLGIANMVPYILQLNAGSSPQAEANFVEHAFERADEIVKQRWMARKIEL